MEEITTEEINKAYEGFEEGLSQDEGDDLITVEEGEE